MFTTLPPYPSHEVDYRREELRRAWGNHTGRSRRRASRTTTAGAERVALAR